MPIGIGYVGAYAQSQFGPEGEVRLYAETDPLLEDLKNWRPDVVGIANYCWNSELANTMFRIAKRLIPNVVCIGGGPDFPNDSGECLDYLKRRPAIDFYVYLEGETAFISLARKIYEGQDVGRLKSEPQDSVKSIHPGSGELVSGSTLARPMDLDFISSPYLTGMMDQWFDGNYAPSVQTSRGCPFRCGFCVEGGEYHSRIARFSTERIKQEFSYMAERMTTYPNVLLSVVDSNFGMYKRDEELAEHLREMQDKYGWPNAFDVTTGKANYDRILRIAERLKNKMNVTCSVQSMNEDTLDVIQRKNVSMDHYTEIQVAIKKRGMISNAELIMPMPMETKQTFLDGLRKVTDAGVEMVSPYTLMMLKGTYLATKECRDKYQMKTRYRILPRQFGEYMGEKCFEIEEVCIATNTMPFEDYLECRGMGLVHAIFSSEQYDIIHRHLKELGISKHDFMCWIWEAIKSGETELSEAYARFIEETKGELWESPEAIYEYFSSPEKYDRLVSGEIGDNLMRKYRIEVFAGHCTASIELAYRTIQALAGEALTEEVRESLEASKRWMIALRDLTSIFNGRIRLSKDARLDLPYDVEAWYRAGPDSESLLSFHRSASYRLVYERERIEGLFDQGKRLFGTDPVFWISKLLTNWRISNFWLRCEPLSAR
jgi:radical SAM superfamily enzyme YgiQ (UPF0313 family)